jgi:hypothetical protein
VIEIAKRAGVTKSTFFRHFSDKRQVLFGQDVVAGPLARGIAAARPRRRRSRPVGTTTGGSCQNVRYQTPGFLETPARAYGGSRQSSRPAPYSPCPRKSLTGKVSQSRLSPVPNH